MMIFNGKKEAEKILLDLKKRIREKRLKPKLAVILIGDDPVSKLYIKLKKKAGQAIGINVLVSKFRADVKEREVIKKIRELNKNKTVNGILVQLPLPHSLNAKNITAEINPKKDVDGFQKNSHFFPVLPLAIFLALQKGVKSFGKKKILSLVNSDIFGRTLQKFLGRKKIKIGYILRSKYSREDIRKKTKSADIIITVCGVPNLIKGDMVKKGVILIDAGITRLPEGRTLGDIDREAVKGKASFLTPVPGGIGPLTVAFLLKNTYLAANRYKYECCSTGKTN